ncbi:MAG: AraC family transcriptional regulator [Cyanobacteria bacterium P01_A01_bin.116]
MKKPAAEISVYAHQSEGLLLEQYAYTAGWVEPILKHSHEEYQFSLSFDCHGEYTYRGEVHQIPVERLSVVHSGEVHAPSDCPHLPEPAHFAMAHIHPKWLSAVATEIAGSPSASPFFATVLPKDTLLTRLFLEMSAVATRQGSQLEKDSALWDFLSCLVGRYAVSRPPAKVSSSNKKAVIVAQDYLRSHYRDDISLDQLATLSGLSRFHFCRLFHQQVGVSASTYQTHLRLAQAKRLLANGREIIDTAIATGFYDQSHFGKYFKRHVGTTPARYLGQIEISS